jgi:hypothetical protein
MPKFPIINIFREKSDSIIIIDFLFITSLTLKLIISRINVRENRIGNQQFRDTDSIGNKIQYEEKQK